MPFRLFAISIFLVMPLVRAAALTATTTTLVSSPNPSTLGQPVTLTATISPAPAFARVTFYDGTTVLGTSAAFGFSGQATLSTRFLPSGGRALRAYYAGNATFEPSASPTLVHTVVALPQNGFLGAVNYGTGGNPYFVAVADFNGDGNADLYGVGVLLGKGDGTYELAANSGTSASSFSAALGDFNGDAKTDLAVVKVGGGGAVEVLLGRGDGTFQSSAVYFTGGVTLAVVAGDFNGDGNADLAASSDFVGLSVLLGKGDGTFQERINYSVGGRPLGVVAGDFNGDGKADLASAVRGSPVVGILLGKGDGTFQGVVQYSTGSNPFSLASADFNGDGRPDLVVGGETGGVTLLLGNGNGTFQAGVGYITGSGLTAVALGDFSGDGKPDLAVSNSTSNNVSVLLGRGDGTFQPAVNHGVGSVPASLAVADLNGDGITDLAVANSSSGNVSLLFGAAITPDLTISKRHAGVFTAGAVATYTITVSNIGGGPTVGRVTATDTLPAALTATSLAGTGWTCILATLSCERSDPLGGFGSYPPILLTVSVASDADSSVTNVATVSGGSDVNTANNSASDPTTILRAITLTLAHSPNPSALGQTVNLAAVLSPTSATGRIVFYDGTTLLGSSALSSGRATLTTRFLPAGRRSLRAYYSGDAATVAGTSATEVHTVTSLPQSGFLPAVNYATAGAPFSLAVADLNGDSLADLVTANFNGNNVSVLLGKSDGTFQGAVNYNVGIGPASLAVGDFNGDGRADLAVANYSSNSVSVLLARGDGTFLAAVTYNAGTGPVSVATGDFDGDGKADLAAANYSSNNVSILLGRGDGTFLAAVNYGAGSGPFSVALADFNSDGKADLAVANGNSNNVSVLLGKGDGTFQAAVNYVSGGNPNSVVAGDFNADGKADLATANANGNNVSVLLGNGDGVFQAATNYSAGSGPSSVALGDFSGDGIVDLAVANANSNNVSVLLGRGDGTFQATVNYVAGLNVKSLAVGDFNRDAVSDLAVANANSNTVSILLGVEGLGAPVINSGGVVTGANYATRLAPGVITTLFGSNLSAGILVATSVPLPTSLGGVSVSVNGTPAPLFYVSPTQINFQLPWELLGQTQSNIVVSVSGSVSGSQASSLGAVSPGIFSTNSSGSGQGAIQIANTAIFAASAGSISGAQTRPAQRGEFLTIYCSGLGDVSPRPATGAAASGLSATVLTPSVTIGGVTAPVTFSGLSPGFVGLYQVNVQVPDSAPAGAQVPVAMTIGGLTSNTVSIAVQ